MEELTRDEVAARARSTGRYIFVINNAVYDVTDFANDHPGGKEVYIQNAGGDASQCFFHVGHSEEARSLMNQFTIGVLPLAERRPELVRTASGGTASATQEPVTLSSLLSAATPPLALAVIATLFYFFILS